MTAGLVTAALGVLILAGWAGALPTATMAASGSTPTAAFTVAVTPGLPTPIKHVFLIMMENEETSVIYGNQPFETQLADQYAWGGDANNASKVGYYAVCHPSAPNYLVLTSGQTLQCGSDAYNTYSVNNLGNLLQTAGESWVAYEEGANVPCQTYNSGLYVVRHNPFPYYSDLGGNTTGSVCMTHDVPIANLTTDYPYNSTPPAFTYIAPNILDDAHSSSAAFGDYWLSTFIPKLMAQSWFSDSVIFITYDEAYTANGNYNAHGYYWLHGGPVYTVAVSPYTRGVGQLQVNTSHYNLLTTMEWLLHLPPTGSGHDGTWRFPAMTGLFQSRIFGPGVNMHGADLEATSLSGYNLAGDDLAGVNFTGTDLATADLRGANLRGADLAGANLTAADLRGANIQGADLVGAILSGANFRGADLQFADLSSATLTGLGPRGNERTNFDGADLYHADLSGAVCGSPNYIVASGANTNAVAVPGACHPPL